ncbi:hypothetical protein [Algoriphagus sp. CAU 1675]|uniref:hypothetical protein n=1 Tax=Algoriphagus sp. CAU 1675 TaxID=3032597 RepID=UPI0023D9F21E|nr:hypothetical protein [Algoriphagus sp. CAU 1675]MDF2158626.1 hypothetical protein [Algoriphagus sp. CAU 1675]
MAKFGLILFLLLSPLLAYSQDVEVEAYFMQDSAKLGERVGYVLKATYPESRQLIFVDSTYDFSPFVLLEKKTFISSTTEGVTKDSVVYYLSNFELEPSAHLSLPVYELSRYDSITYFPLEAELKLKLALDSIPEEPAFLENNEYQVLEKKWNWALFGFMAGVLILTSSLLYFLFANRIRELWKHMQEKRRWSRFEKAWAKNSHTLQTENSIEAADELLGLWKGYMESITEKPFKEWTSSEIGDNLEDMRVFSSLRAVELIIYANKKEEIGEACNYLLEIAKRNYEEKLKPVKHDRATV